MYCACAGKEKREKGRKGTIYRAPTGGEEREDKKSAPKGAPLQMRGRRLNLGIQAELEAADCGSLGIVNIEYGKQPGELQDVVEFLT